MPIINDPRDTAALFGDVNQAATGLPSPGDVPAPPLLNTLAAASRISFAPGATYERIVQWNAHAGDDEAAPAGWDPLDHVPSGMEPWADSFANARSPSEIRGIASRVRGEMQDRETLHRAGVGGPVAEIAMGLIDPTFWVAVAVPEIAIARFARASKVATAAARGAAGAGAYEAAMHSLQETRTSTESLFNIAGGAILSGVIGSLGRHASPEEIVRARQLVERDLVNPNPDEQSFGAAAARGSALELEGWAAGGETFAKIAGKVPFAKTDIQRVMESESLAAHQVMHELVEVPGVLGHHLRGQSSAVAVESLVERHMGRIGDFAHELRQAWKAYKKRPLGEVEVRLTRQQFEEAVSFAARRGDRAVEPEVERAAAYLRSRVFDPLKRDAQTLRLLPADGEIQSFAESYFKRMYDRNKIRANRAAWDELLLQHYIGKGLERVEARAVAEDVTRTILGTEVGLANFNIRPKVPNAGPLEARVLDLRDELIEPFLVNDPVKVASAYVREMAPQIELTKRFGDKEARDLFQRVRDDYGVKRSLARNEGDAKRIDKLQTEEKETLDTLSRLVLRMYGRAGALAPEASEGTRKAVKFLRDWRNLVASAKLGGVAITGGVQDLGRIVASYGFLPTMSKLTKLVTSREFRQVSMANARRLGVATEVAMARRVAIASDGAVTEGWSERLAMFTYQASGLNHVTDFWRTLSATLIEDKILGAAADVAAGKTLSKGLITDLAQIGISKDFLPAIAEQAATHGQLVDGMRTSGSMQWTRSAMAEIYDAAIVKEARVAVMQPGLGDRVWWTDSELGKTIGQLKAFAISAPLRLTMAPIQMIGQGRYGAAARFTGAMMIGGYLSHVFRQLAAGKQPSTDPVAAAGEAFAESGLGGILPDIASPFARRFGWFGESARFSDRNVGSAFGGPAVGLGFDAYDVVMNRSRGGVSANDLEAFRRLLPAQNIWYLRRAINALEGEVAEALGLQGATTQTFAERMLETKPLASSTARGGTGTGALVQ